MIDGRPHWRDLCAAIANEQDPDKVLELSVQLLAVLGERNSTARPAGQTPIGDLLAGNGRSEWDEPEWDE